MVENAIQAIFCTTDKHQNTKSAQKRMGDVVNTCCTSRAVRPCVSSWMSSNGRFSARWLMLEQESAEAALAALTRDLAAQLALSESLYGFVLRLINGALLN
jgi:hypothetical protein